MNKLSLLAVITPMLGTLLLAQQKIPDKPPQAPPARPVERPAAPVLVKEVLVKFHTNDDDKDRDTKLTTDFMCRDSIFASSNINPTSQLTFSNGVFFTQYSDSFSNNRDTPWINVGVSNTVAKATIHSCQTKIRIDPNGHDTWKFNYWVKLVYTDGTHDEYHFDGHALSEKTRENVFNLN